MFIWSNINTIEIDHLSDSSTTNFHNTRYYLKCCMFFIDALMDTNNCASSSDCAANETNKDMNFRILSTAGRVRHGVLNLTHGSVHTPVFMPVGTQGKFFEITIS